MTDRESLLRDRERRNAGIALVVAFPLSWQFFGALALLMIGGGWGTFLWFGGGVTMCLYGSAFGAYAVAWFLDWRNGLV